MCGTGLRMLRDTGCKIQAAEAHAAPSHGTGCARAAKGQEAKSCSASESWCAELCFRILVCRIVLPNPGVPNGAAESRCCMVLPPCRFLGCQSLVPHPAKSFCDAVYYRLEGWRGLRTREGRADSSTGGLRTREEGGTGDTRLGRETPDTRPPMTKSLPKP